MIESLDVGIWTGFTIMAIWLLMSICGWGILYCCFYEPSEMNADGFIPGAALGIFLVGASCYGVYTAFVEGIVLEVLLDFLAGGFWVMLAIACICGVLETIDKVVKKFSQKEGSDGTD